MLKACPNCDEAVDWDRAWGMMRKYKCNNCGWEGRWMTRAYVPHPTIICKACGVINRTNRQSCVSCGRKLRNDEPMTTTDDQN